MGKEGLRAFLAVGALLAMGAFLGLLFAQDREEAASGSRTVAAPFDNIIQAHAGNMLERGREIFRYDTFGSQEALSRPTLPHGGKFCLTARRSARPAIVPPLYSEPGNNLHAPVRFV